VSLAKLGLIRKIFYEVLKALRSRLPRCCRLRKRTAGAASTRTNSQSTKRVELLLLLAQLGSLAPLGPWMARRVLCGSSRSLGGESR